MKDQEFGRLLQAYMFGATSRTEERHLAEAALLSSERALQFATTLEIREHLEDPAFRRDLLETLPAVARPTGESLWRAVFRPEALVPLVGGAAIAIAALVVRDLRSHDVPVTGGVAVRTTVADREGAPAADGLDTASTDATSRVDMTSLFELPRSEESTVSVMLLRGSQYGPTETVSAVVTLPQAGVLTAIVRGPSGRLREVYPGGPDTGRALPAGTHEFSFPARGSLDPATGGHSLLRVFVVGEEAGAPRGEDRWAWLRAKATVEEIEYAYAVVP
jgi:hypothetical protein